MTISTAPKEKINEYLHFLLNKANANYSLNTWVDLYDKFFTGDNCICSQISERFSDFKFDANCGESYLDNCKWFVEAFEKYTNHKNAFPDFEEWIENTENKII